MKNCKWMFLTALLLVSLLLAGCMNTGERAAEPSVSPAVSATGDTGDVGDAGGTDGSGLENGGAAGAGAATPFDWAANAAQVETALNNLSEISDSRVVVTGTTALVAVKYTGAYRGETTERIREMVAGVVRQADPTIQTVAVTSAKEDVTAVYKISDQVRAGASTDAMAEDINRIVRNPTTLR